MENVLFCSILAVETFHVKRLIVIKTIFSNQFTCSQRISWESKTIFSNQFTYSLKRCLATSYERHSLSISATREVGFSFIFMPLFNPFHASGLFLYFLKTSENQRISDVARGFRKRPMALSGLMPQYLLRMPKHFEIFSIGV